MHVLVTGGTGFVGSHTVAALQAAGHDLRLLARTPSRVAPALRAVGGDPDAVEVVTGDLTDPAVVPRALDGVDAVLHAASIFSLDPRRADEIRRVNHDTTEHLLAGAVDRGLDPIVHVSSTLALYRQGVAVQELSSESPPGDSPFPYSGSKADQERLARGWQDRGAPVVTTCPGAVIGPHDPYDGESSRMARSAVRGAFTFCPTGDIAVADVRDVAALHARLFEPGRGPRRYVLAHAVPFAAFTRGLLRVAGVRRPVLPIPDRAASLVGRVAGRLQDRVTTRLPVNGEVVWLATQSVRVDAGPAAQLGVTCRPVRESLVDQLAWQRAAGRL